MRNFARKSKAHFLHYHGNISKEPNVLKKTNQKPFEQGKSLHQKTFVGDWNITLCEIIPERFEQLLHFKE